MIMGFYVTYYSFVNASTCNMPKDVSFWGLAMYASYFVLFANFFIKSYLSSDRRKASTKQANGSSSTTRKVKKVD